MIGDSGHRGCKQSSITFPVEPFSDHPAAVTASEPSAVDVVSDRESCKSAMDDFVPKKTLTAEIALRLKDTILTLINAVCTLNLRWRSL